MICLVDCRVTVMIFEEVIEAVDFEFQENNKNLWIEIKLQRSVILKVI